MSTRTARIFRPLAPTIAIVVILAACASEPEATASPEAVDSSPTAAASVAPESPAAEESPAADEDATAMTGDSDVGEILTDADGMTIYFFANDTEDTSNCTGECLENWPPVLVDDDPTAGEGVTAELGTITAADGGDQLTVNGFPAYYFAGDADVGATNGQGVGGVWWVFGPDGEPIEE